MNRFVGLLLLAAIACSGTLFSADRVEAHSQSYGFLRATVHDNSISGQVELAVRDLDLAYALDADGDGNVTWGELRKRESEIAPVVLRGISIGTAGAPCDLVPAPIAIDSRGGENYAIFPFTGACESPGGRVRIGYDLMFGSDAQHRGLVDLARGSIGRSTVMTPEARVAVIDLSSDNRLDVFRSFVPHGANHIWTGFDHLLFLATLLLSAVVMRSGDRWQAVETFGGAAWATTKVVTAFTLAHSITLSAAAFNLVELPTRFVESIIAISVAAAAINNLFPIVTRRLWIAAFAFGLMHGLGFAGTLADLGLPPTRKLVALLAFNLGVEFGQLAVVAVLLPVLFLIRRSVTYTQLALPAGSAIIAAIGILWFLQRATEMSIIPG
jgi:hypothetical protein